MKKLKMLSLLPILGICACSGPSNYYGTYSFMLGKMNESHVRVAFTFKENAYTYTDISGQEKTKGQEFNAEIDVGDNISIDLEKMGINLPEGIDVEIANKELTKLLKEFLTNLKGYYIVSDSETTYGKRLHIGTTIGVTNVGGIEIPSDLVEYVIVSYINAKTLTLQLPVSIPDLIYQLSWYGYLINTESPTGNYVVELDKDKLPGETDKEKRFGTHPVNHYDKDGQLISNEVNLMNLAFCKEFSNTPLYLKDGTDKLVHVGNIVETSEIKYDSEGEPYTAYYHNLFNTTSGSTKWTPSSADFTAYVKAKNDYGVFDKLTEINCGIMLDEFIKSDNCQIYKFEEAITGIELDRKSYMQKPFTFRDFHDIKMGLARE